MGHVVDLAALLMLVVSFGACPFFVVNWLRYVWRKKKRAANACVPVKSIAIFVGAMTLGFLFSDMLKFRARQEIAMYLDGVKDAKVFINGYPMTDSRTLIETLQAMPSIGAHHSHPERRFNIIIESGKGTLKLALGRDSQRPQEYWVFYPRYMLTNSNDAFRIYTSQLDKY